MTWKIMKGLFELIFDVTYQKVNNYYDQPKSQLVHKVIKRWHYDYQGDQILQNFAI
jgi:hypothetical protein